LFETNRKATSPAGPSQSTFFPTQQPSQPKTDFQLCPLPDQPHMARISAPNSIAAPYRSLTIGPQSWPYHDPPSECFMLTQVGKPTRNPMPCLQNTHYRRCSSFCHAPLICHLTALPQQCPAALAQAHSAGTQHTRPAWLARCGRLPPRRRHCLARLPPAAPAAARRAAGRRPASGPANTGRRAAHAAADAGCGCGGGGAQPAPANAVAGRAARSPGHRPVCPARPMIILAYSAGSHRGVLVRGALCSVLSW
jgi:hypothetical protein